MSFLYKPTGPPDPALNSHATAAGSLLQSLPVVVPAADEYVRPQRTFFTVAGKFGLSFAAGLSWMMLSWWIARPWIDELTGLAGVGVALFAIGGIALVPGFMNAFLAVSLLLDRRPQRRIPTRYPAISILVAAYNEGGSIADTIASIEKSDYPGTFEVIVIDDGSLDATAEIAATQTHSWLRVLRQTDNQGKSAALNRGLAEARHDLIVTLDGDSYLYRDALQRLVERY
jgi:poly-beta-1,6-N-acetyl-D-glucosamine synthase